MLHGFTVFNYKNYKIIKIIKEVEDTGTRLCPPRDNVYCRHRAVRFSQDLTTHSPPRGTPRPHHREGIRDWGV